MSKLTSKRAKEIRKLRVNYPNRIKLEEVITLWKGALKTVRLAKIIGQINGDGSLQLDKDRSIVSFNSNNFYEIENIDKEFKELFGINGIIYRDYNKLKNKICFLGKKITLFLLVNGVVKGNKTNQSFGVPYWICKGNKKVKGAFLKGIYDTEGSIYSTLIKENKIRWKISLRQNKNIILKESGILYMEQIRSLLKELGVNSSPIRIEKGNIRNDGSKSISLRFDIEKKGFDNFYKYIGFDNKKKQERLVKSLNMDTSPSG